MNTTKKPLCQITKGLKNNNQIPRDKHQTITNDQIPNTKQKLLGHCLPVGRQVSWLLLLV
jgi:hypothetical protein